MSKWPDPCEKQHNSTPFLPEFPKKTMLSLQTSLFQKNTPKLLLYLNQLFLFSYYFVPYSQCFKQKPEISNAKIHHHPISKIIFK